MNERGTGVFSSVSSTSNTSEESVTVTLTSVAPNSRDTIYNLIFKDYEEEKGE